MQTRQGARIKTQTSRLAAFPDYPGYPPTFFHGVPPSPASPPNLAQKLDATKFGPVSITKGTAGKGQICESDTKLHKSVTPLDRIIDAHHTIACSAGPAEIKARTEPAEITQFGPVPRSRRAH